MPLSDGYRYSSLPAGLSGGDIMFANTLSDEERQQKLRLQNGGSIGNPVITLPRSWNGFYGSLGRTQQDASDAGMDFKVNMTGIGQRATAAPRTGDDMTDAQIAGNEGLSDYTAKLNQQRLSLRALQAQARTAEDAASQADWKDDPYQQAGDLEDALKRQSTIDDFDRAQRVKNAGSLAAEYQAAEPFRNAANYDQDQRLRSDFQYGKVAGDIEKARIETGGKIREAEARGAADRSQALRSLADLAKARAGQQPQVPDPTGATEGGFLGIGAKPKMVPNPAYDDLTQSMRAAYDVLGANPDDQPTGKTMSLDDLSAFAQQNGMDLPRARAMARQYGWTIR